MSKIRINCGGFNKEYFLIKNISRKLKLESNRNKRKPTVIVDFSFFSGVDMAYSMILNIAQ
jgi:hypothetical protein